MKLLLKISLLIVSEILCNVSRSGAQDKKDLAQNPLLNPGTLPFRAVPFDKIKESDFRPAFDEGIRLQNAEIQQIADNPAAPTFENTMIALEKNRSAFKPGEQHL